MIDQFVRERDVGDVKNKEYNTIKVSTTSHCPDLIANTDMPMITSEQTESAASLKTFSSPKRAVGYQDVIESPLYRCLRSPQSPRQDSGLHQPSASKDNFVLDPRTTESYRFVHPNPTIFSSGVDMTNRSLCPDVSMSRLVIAQSGEGPKVSETLRTFRKRQRQIRKKRSFMIASLIESDSESGSDHGGNDDGLPSKRSALCGIKHSLNDSEILASEDNTFQRMKNFPLDFQKSESFPLNSSSTQHQRPNYLPLKSVERVLDTSRVSGLHVENVENNFKDMESNESQSSRLHGQRQIVTEKEFRKECFNGTQKAASLKMKNPSSPIQSKKDLYTQLAQNKGSEFHSTNKIQMPHPPFPSPLWPVFPIDEMKQQKSDRMALNVTSPDADKGKNQYQIDNSAKVGKYPTLFQPLPLRLFPAGASLHPYLSQGFHPFHVPHMQYQANENSAETSERKGSFLNHFQTFIENTAMMNTPLHFQETVSPPSNPPGLRLPTNETSSNMHCVNGTARHQIPNCGAPSTTGPTFSPCGSDGISLASSSDPGLSPAPSASLSSPSSPRPHHLLNLSPRSFMSSDRSGSTSLTMTAPVTPRSDAAKATTLGINNSIHACPPRLGLRYDHLQLKMSRGSSAGFMDSSKSFKAFLEVSLRNETIKLIHL